MEGNDWLDEETQSQIEFTIRYGDLTKRDRGLLAMFGTWWARRCDSPKWLEKGQAYWKWRWAIEVTRIKRMVLLQETKNMRCPECGAKLRVRNCLACDLRAKRVRAVKLKAKKDSHEAEIA